MPLTAALASSQLAGSGLPSSPSSTRRTRARGAGSGGGADGSARGEVEVMHRAFHGQGGGEVRLASTCPCVATAAAGQARAARQTAAAVSDHTRARVPGG